MKLQIGIENTRSAGLVRSDENSEWRLPTEEEKIRLFAPWRRENPEDINNSVILDGDGDWLAQSDNSDELISRFNMLSSELQRIKS